MTPQDLITQAKTGEMPERFIAFAAMMRSKCISCYIEPLKEAASEDTEDNAAIRVFTINSIKHRPDILKYAPDMLDFLEKIIEKDSSPNVKSAAKYTLSILRGETKETSPNLSSMFEQTHKEIAGKIEEEEPCFLTNTGDLYIQTIDPDAKIHPAANSYWVLPTPDFEPE